METTLTNRNRNVNLYSRMAAKTPMDIEVILDSIFRYLKFEDLKRCRLVNRKYNTVANRLLRKLGTCVLKNPDCRCSKISKINEPLNKELINMLPTKFVLRTPYPCFCNWKMDNLASLLAYYSPYIQQLKIDGLNIEKMEYLKIDNIGRLSELKIDSNIRFTIPIQKLANIRSLHLAKNCTIKIEDTECKISLLKLRLSNVAFFPSKNEEIILNDFFNLSKTAHLDLTFDDCVVQLKLDSKINFDYLSLSGIRITHPGAINGNVDVLNMNWVKAFEMANFDQVNVKILKAICNLKGIYLLPKSVQQLNLKLLTNSDASLDVFRQTAFPQLEILKLTCSNSTAFISIFGQLCNMIKRVQFNSNLIVMTSLPTSINKVILKENAKIISNSTIKVETLILNLYSLRSAKIILNKIATINLVLHLSDVLHSNKEVEFIISGDLYYGPIFKNSETKYFRRNKGIDSEISNDVFSDILKDV